MSEQQKFFIIDFDEYSLRHHIGDDDDNWMIVSVRSSILSLPDNTNCVEWKLMQASTCRTTQLFLLLA